MKKSLIASVVLAAVLGLGVSTSKALPISVTLTIDALQSGINVQIDALGGITASVDTTLSGTQDITLDDSDPLATSLTFDGGAVGLADASLGLNLGPLGLVRAGFLGAGLSGLTSTGSIPLNFAGGTWNYLFDPGDPNGGNVTSIEINSGLLTYNGTGSIGLLLGSGTLDFASSPAGFDLPSLGQVASLTQTLLGSTGVTTTYSIVLSAPISVSADVLTDPLPVAGTIVGQIVASGTYIVVPEPSTMVLLGVALAGLIPLYRRMKK